MFGSADGRAPFDFAQDKQGPPLHEPLQHLMSSFENFVEDSCRRACRADDITLLLVRYQGASEA